MQMVVVLKKLTCGALLSPLEASEEFREGIIKCFKAIFMNLYPCPNDACSCKKISGSPALAENREFQGHLDVLSEESKPNECLLEFLRSETASAAVGHWLSLLLKVWKNMLSMIFPCFLAFSLSNVFCLFMSICKGCRYWGRTGTSWEFQTSYWSLYDPSHTCGKGKFLTSN